MAQLTLESLRRIIREEIEVAGESADPVAIYNIYDVEDDPKFMKQLRAMGFKRSKSKENLYNPKHWKSVGAQVVADFYVDMDSFNALTPEAKKWAESEEI